MTDRGVRLLALAALAKAVEDGAAAFLAGPDAEPWCWLAGIPFRALARARTPPQGWMWQGDQYRDLEIVADRGGRAARSTGRPRRS